MSTARAVRLCLSPRAVAAEGIAAATTASGARRLRRRAARAACTCTASRVARASAGRRPAGGAAHLSRLLVRLPRRAATRGSATIHVARVDVGVAIDVDVRVAAAAIAITAPRCADGGAPDHARRQCGSGRIRVVVRRVRRRVVDRRCTLHDHGRRVVLRHVDHLRIRGLDDDGLLLDLHHLLVVGLEAARGLRLAAKDLYRFDHCALVRHDRLAQRCRPVEVAAHHLHDVGIVEQRLHGVVPLVVDGKFRVGLALLEKAIRLHELQRIGRRRQDDRDEIVGIQRDRADQLGEIRFRHRRNRPSAGCRRLRSGMCSEYDRDGQREENQPQGAQGGTHFIATIDSNHVDS